MENNGRLRLLEQLSCGYTWKFVERPHRGNKHLQASICVLLKAESNNVYWRCMFIFQVMAFQHVDNCRSLYINCQGEERRDKSEEYIMKARAEYLVSTRLRVWRAR